MPFPERFLDELIARNDIVDVVSDYVQLTKRSGNNQFGLCPFHSEKTPSFSVSSDKQIYHCFGCGKGGSVINFIMEMENLSFPDAVRFLAKRAGLEVPEDDPRERDGRRTRLLKLNADAARFFYENLSKPCGAAAVAYIRKRGIAPATVKRFGLGAAPDSWDALTNAMMAKGYTAGELLEADLVKKGKNGGVYDTFRDRLMFPVIDVRGSVIGFSGRVLGDGEPKYLNSRDTPVFSKSRNLFGLNLAKKTKREALILAEGNIDVVSLHQAGFDCAVASLGTSLTPDQARLMSRYKDKVVIAYDADAAGVKAAQRAIGLLEPTGMNVKVLRMSGAKDPDEFIQKNGAAAFEVLMDRSENHVEYRLLAAQAKYALETDDGRVGFLKEATDILASLPSAIERDVYGRRVAETAGVSPEAVGSEVAKAVRRRAADAKKRREREAQRPEQTVQPRDRQLRYDNVASAMAEEGVIRLIMLDPTLLADAEGLTGEAFTSPCLGKVFDLVRERESAGKETTLVSLTPYLEPEEMAHITAVLQKPESRTDGERKMRDYIDRIQREAGRRAAREDPLEAMRAIREKKRG